MTAIDTSAEAVERLARHAALSEDDRHVEAAATLRALLSERDAARTDVAAVLAENDALRFDRNNLRAEAARWREPWLRVIQTDNSCDPTGRPCGAKRCGCDAELDTLARDGGG